MLYSDGHVIVSDCRYELEHYAHDLGFSERPTDVVRWDRRHFFSRRKYLACIAAGVVPTPTELIEYFLEQQEPQGSRTIECLIDGLYERKYPGEA